MSNRHYIAIKFRYTITASLLLVGTRGLYAKGLNQLKPGNPEETAVEEQNDPESIKQETNTKTDTNNAQAVETASDNAMETKKDENITPSALSTALADRLHLGTSILWTSINSDKADWHTGFTSGLQLSWQLTKFYHDKLAVFITSSYQAVDTVTKLDSNQYRGAIQTFSIGSHGTYDMNTYAIHLGLLAGYTTTSLDPIEDSDPNKELNKAGSDLSLFTGVSWRVRPKLDLGPMIHLGFGTFSSIRGGVNASFVF